MERWRVRRSEFSRVHAARVGLPWMSHWPSVTTRATHRRTATSRRARPRWRRSIRVGRVLIDAQIAAPAFLGHNHRLSKKLHSLPSSIRRIIQTRGHSCTDPAAEAPFGPGLTLSDRFYTPTLIRPDNRREGWLMSHKIDLGCRHIHSGAA